MAKRRTDVFIHPKALVESNDIGPGTRIWAFAHVMKSARIGSGCNICDHSFIESNAILGNNVTVKNGVSIWDRIEIGDNVFIGPNAVFTNDLNPRAEVKKPREEWLPTVIKNGATIGANATVLCGITVGRYAFIAAGTVVTADVPDYAMAIGVPGRLSGWMCACGTRIQMSGVEGSCEQCGRRYTIQKDGGLAPANGQNPQTSKDGVDVSTSRY
jgi:UDP-2-acetamido-3-amino-2,3-dideoxy-glucuronate N-acetyltransferase